MELPPPTGIKLPKRYIKKDQRQKNNTPLLDEYWNKCVLESIEYDRLMDERATATKELDVKEQPRELLPIQFRSFAAEFIKCYEHLYSVKFELDNETEFLLKIIIYNKINPAIFNQGELAFTSIPLIQKKVLNEIQSIRYEKELFIVGGFGLGKTSMLKAFDYMLFNSAEILVEDSEGNILPLRSYSKYYSPYNVRSAVELRELREFDKKTCEMVVKSRYLTIDDIFRETKLYGTEIIADIIEERYRQGLKTSIVCNYLDSSPNCLDSVLAEYAKRYGSHLLDRAFEQFNFIKLTGKSKRK